ncbi:hypothetical protein G647_02934 [Cladophialophora carrionii CBS 160.54]|uniref:Uncharacterized protein n=1 Tax=Cladophialophora carrionii CBS 160.54 TaxID=1279043 RepID=V9DJN8_9EURO|nr:uncharacterized protein G647_02934 [Cladophialophora carrionii CBS 160.54]ETI26157.1 hypothetical protein G647_02934 [Cladophialophora carrionii CBS 160.54]
MVALSEHDILDVNTISRFLACSQIPSLWTCDSADVLVFCGNAILPIAEHVFSALEARPELTRTLVICGGLGHSTQFLYDAVRNSEKYRNLADQPHGLPEATVYELMLKRYYPKLAERIEGGETELIIEDKSTNCGANAICTRQVLELHGITKMKTCIIVQDPTMSLRTLAAFQHTYQDVAPSTRFLACPTFVPRVYLDRVGSGDTHVVADSNESVNNIKSATLWEPRRFFDLLMGEIPRLRDDENGYGPRGKDFIVHVDIPEEVETAWARLKKILNFKR